MTMEAIERWLDEYPADLEAEVTGYTSQMKDTIYDLAPKEAVTTDLGAELRVTVPGGRRFAFLGQPASIQGMQGANPDRIAYWKRREPVTFVAVQGGVGWLLTVRMATPSRPISHRTGAHRVGWHCAEMLKVAFDVAAFERHEGNKQPAVMWRWDLNHELPTEGGLF